MTWLQEIACENFIHVLIAQEPLIGIHSILYRVNEYLQIKVADFGLAKDVYMTDYYRQTTTGKIPAKWMAPEALHDRISNEKTDVVSLLLAP